MRWCGRMGLRTTKTILGPGLMAAPALALAQVKMVPHPWEILLQQAHSPVKAGIDLLNDWVTGIMIGIVILVAGLLLTVCVRFNARANPVPSTRSHNTPLEIAWTVIPILILLAIAVPSFRLVYYEDRTQHADLTVKVTGHQWYWEYAYPDDNNIDFTSYILPQDQLKPGQLRLLDVDNQMVVPYGKNIRVLTTSADVIHSFFVPSLGVQRYAIPGRTIETWFRADAPGLYYGECNQICGINHSQMPIVIHAVTPAEFTAWVASQSKTKTAAAMPSNATSPNLQLASAAR